MSPVDGCVPSSTSTGDSGRFKSCAMDWCTKYQGDSIILNAFLPTFHQATLGAEFGGIPVGTKAEI